jgi:hypothetical protein
LIIALSPLPDELERSFLGRLRRLNGLQTEKEIINLLTLWADIKVPLRRDGCTLELLGLAAHMDLPTFVRKHTTLPLRRAITLNRTNVHGSPENQSMLRLTGMRLTRPAAYFCADCIEFDHENIGMSYWRRDHQIPGVSSCANHRCALRYVDDLKSFLAAPSDFLRKSDIVNSNLARSERQNAKIQNFLKMSRALINLEKPIHTNNAYAALREKALIHGWRALLVKNEKSFLSDFILKNFPNEWLLTVLPFFSEKIIGDPLKKVDGVLYSATTVLSVTPYVFAFSLFFESVDEAFESMNVGLKDIDDVFSSQAATFPRKDLEVLLQHFPSD